MTEFDRCTVCKGRRIVTSLGMIEKKCVACGGVGHVSIKTPVFAGCRINNEDEPGVGQHGSLSADKQIIAISKSDAKLKRLQQLKNEFV